MTRPLNTLVLGMNTIAYRTAGSGPDVLLIHGWQSSSRMWDETMEFLSRHFRVWAIDLMGFGDSRNDDPARLLSLDDQTRLVVKFCEALDLHPHMVMGHSMGGCITLKLALDYPELVDNIVLVSPVVTGNLRWKLGRLLTTSAGKSVFLNLGQHLWPQISRLRGHLSIFIAAGQPPRAVKRTVEDFQKSTWGGAYGGLISLIDPQLDGRLDTIVKPALVITGAGDLTIPPSEGRYAAKNIPGARYLEIPHCRHHVPDEQPEHFFQAVGAFLKIEDRQAEYAISAA